MKILLDEFPLFPLRAVLFPQASMPLQVFEPRYLEMIERCRREELSFGILLIKEGAEVGGPALPYSVGTVARIGDLVRSSDGRLNLAAIGMTRFRLLEASQTRPYLTGRIEVWPEENYNLSKVESLARAAGQAFRGFLSTLQEPSDQEEEREASALRLPKDPSVLSYLIGSHLPVSEVDKQSLLESATLEGRLKREILFIRREIELLRHIRETGTRIRDQASFSFN